MSDNEKMKCPMCGFEFEPGDSQKSCVGCPMHGGCEMARCPNCDYETPAPRRKSKSDKGSKQQ